MLCALVVGSANAQALASYTAVGDAIPTSLTGQPGDAVRGRAIVVNEAASAHMAAYQAIVLQSLVSRRNGSPIQSILDGELARSRQTGPVCKHTAANQSANLLSELLIERNRRILVQTNSGEVHANPIIKHTKLDGLDPAEFAGAPEHNR